MPHLIPSWFRRLTRQKTISPRSVEPTLNYGAVEIQPELLGGCNAVARCRGTRFLMSSAPPIPLPDCDARTCDCRYVRWQDRRQDPRRDADYGIGTQTVLNTERRASKRGRRTSDAK